MIPETTGRELTPLDLALLEPDLLGAVAMAIYGRAGPAAAAAEPMTFRSEKRRARGVRTSPPRV